jgi:hypothetical protein
MNQRLSSWGTVLLLGIMLVTLVGRMQLQEDKASRVEASPTSDRQRNEGAVSETANNLLVKLVTAPLPESSRRVLRGLIEGGLRRVPIVAQDDVLGLLPLARVSTRDEVPREPGEQPDAKSGTEVLAVVIEVPTRGAYDT